jgi:hypothetical protein
MKGKSAPEEQTRKVDRPRLVKPETRERRDRVYSKVDKPWFDQRRADLGLSLRDLASLMSMDVATVSRLLDGKRRWTVEMAAAMARHLGVSSEEIMRRAGADVRGTLEQAVPVVGWVDQSGRMQKGLPAGPGTVQAAPGVSGEGVGALRVIGGSCDGWVLYVRDAEGVAPDGVGRLCLATTREGQRLVGWLKRGYTEGYWRIGPFGEGGEEKEAQLLAASPVLWIRP